MKRLLNFLPTHFTICLMVGIVLQFQFKLWAYPNEIALLSSCVLLITLCWLNRKQKKQLFTFVSWGAFVLLGGLTVFFQDSSNKKNFYTKHDPSNARVVLKIKKSLKSSASYHKYIATVQLVGAQRTTGDVLVHVQKDTISVSLNRDDLIFCSPTFLPLTQPLNPHQFNYKRYLQTQGVHAQLFVKREAYLYQKTTPQTVVAMAGAIRNKIAASLQSSGFNGEELAVIKALVLGQRSDISSSILRQYANAGAIHVLAVSGLHVGIVLLLLNTLLKPLEKIRNGRFIKAIVLLLMLWCFAVIAGLSASVVRAVTMFTAVAIGMALKRKSFVIHSLVTSAFILLLVHPMFLYDVGFQLSYLAVFSIVTIQPSLARLWKPSWKPVAYIWQLFSVSIAAQIGVLPISLFYFHQFPGLFMVSSLVIVPCIGLILSMGLVVIVLSMLDIQPLMITKLYTGIIKQMNSFVGWVANQESFLISEISYSSLLMFLSYACVFFGIGLLEKKSFRKWVFFLSTIAMVQICVIAERIVFQKKVELVVFNHYKKTIIGHRAGNFLQIYHNLDTLLVKRLSMIKNYCIGEQIQQVAFTDSIPSVLRINGKYLLVVDNLGVYPVGQIKKPIVLLREAPKINVERLLQRLQPALLIADGSAFKNDSEYWKNVCNKNGVPFVSTQEKGAYCLE